MKILSAVTLLSAASISIARGDTPGGDNAPPEDAVSAHRSRELGGCYFDSVGSTLEPGGSGGGSSSSSSSSYFERGEGICSGRWGLGLDEKHGRLGLYRGKDVIWDSGRSGMDYCNANRGGAFACYAGEPHHPVGGAIFALNCGGADGSYMEIDDGEYWVVQKKDDVETWAVDKDGDLEGTCVGPSSDGTDYSLVAKYTWKDGAKDVSGSPRRHDGRLDSGASVKDGRLRVRYDDGVNIGRLDELDSAKRVKIQIKDVKFLGLPHTSTGQYCVLVGGGYDKWWVGVNHDFPDDDLPKGRTTLIFNVGGFGQGPRYEHEVVVADEVVTAFGSIEYKYDAHESSKKRLAVRYNGGRWTKGGWKKASHFSTFPDSDEDVRINDGIRADWDPCDANLGAISIWVG